MSEEATDTPTPPDPAPVGETIDAVTRQYKLGGTHVAMMLLDFIKFKEIIPTINLKYFCYQWAKLKSQKAAFKQRAEPAMTHWGSKKQFGWDATERAKWCRTYLEYGELFTTGLITVEAYQQAFGELAKEEASFWDFLQAFGAPAPAEDTGQMTTADVLDEDKPDDAEETKPEAEDEAEAEDKAEPDADASK